MNAPRIPDQGTLDWYINWLAERRPDLTEEVRLEMATSFAVQQLPPVRKPEVDDDAPEEEIVDSRAEQRRSARLLSTKELMDIVSIVPLGKKKV